MSCLGPLYDVTIACRIILLFMFVFFLADFVMNADFEMIFYPAL